MKTQIQFYYEERNKIAEGDILFMQFVKEGMTKITLQKLIKLRPKLWSRYSNWLQKLP